MGKCEVIYLTTSQRNVYVYQVKITNIMSTPALFLDRDGVINVDHGYVCDVENFEFISGIFDLTRDAIKQGFLVLIITNQSGIGRGYYTEEKFLKLTDWMCAQFLKEEAPITKVYYSPYHPIAGKGKYLSDHRTRKPHPGMILDAQVEFSIDLSGSILIGDKASDIAAGNVAGVGLNLLFGSDETSGFTGLKYKRIDSLWDAKAIFTSSSTLMRYD